MNKEYFCFDGQDTTLHENEEEARKEAEAAIEHYRDNAGDGWSDAVNNVCYGKLVPTHGTQPTDVVPNCDCGNMNGDCPLSHNRDVDGTCDYELLEIGG